MRPPGRLEGGQYGQFGVGAEYSALTAPVNIPHGKHSNEVDRRQTPDGLGVHAANVADSAHLILTAAVQV